MCRWCQRLWEDIYWNCFEEKFCYDESIANYNPDDDQDYIIPAKNGFISQNTQQNDNNNVLQVPITRQPGSGNILSNAKIHEEDYRRETQTNVPMLGPEILAVFANSQIFQDHQPTKLNRISTKPYLAGIHTPSKDVTTPPRESDQDWLLRRLEGKAGDNTTDAGAHPEKTIKTNSNDISVENSQIIPTHKFESIPEEKQDDTDNEVILRPRLPRYPQGLFQSPQNASSKTLRPTKSVPYLNFRTTSSEIDIFAITGSSQISMTPEVPSISFTNLPKNYEDTPTIEKYRVSQSLYSIQTANAARISQDDYSMPRYFRRPAQTTETFSSHNIGSSNNEHRPEKEKSKRLQMLRSNLPPLLIHSVSFKKNRTTLKQIE